MKSANIKAIRGYKRHKGFYSGKVDLAAPNLLEREFMVDKPDLRWVTDFTYILTYEGWLTLPLLLIYSPEKSSGGR